MVGVNRQDIVSVFLKFGTLLKQDELDWLLSQSDEIVTAVASSHDPKKELSKRSARRIVFESVKNLTRKPPQVTPDIQAGFFNSRYQLMKQITDERIRRDWVSLNRLPSRGDIFIAGIARNIIGGERTTVEVEDPTGSVSVVFDKMPQVCLDDFVAIHAVASNGMFIGKEILQPDIPLRKAALGTGRGCFISDLHLDEAPTTDGKRLFVKIAEENIDWVFLAGDVGDIGALEKICGNVPLFIIPGDKDSTDGYPQLPLQTNRPNIIALSNPSVVRVGGLGVLMCHVFTIDMLRKRHLGTAQSVTEDDFLALDVVPDIVACGHDHKPLVSHYKATTIINAGSLLSHEVPIIVDFMSREWKPLMF